MDTETTIQKELELTSEQKKVLGKVYRLILSWEREIPDGADHDSKISDKTPSIVATAVEEIPEKYEQMS